VESLSEALPMADAARPGERYSSPSWGPWDSASPSPRWTDPAQTQYDGARSDRTSSMPVSLILTIVGPDRPGLVNLISDRVTSLGGNWLESRMANLAGQFAGIVHLHVPEANAEPLIAAFRDLEAQGLRIVVTRGTEAAGAPPGRRMKLELVGQDRPGVVRDISHALASRGVSIEELVTDFVSGSMSGESLVRASAQLRVPAQVRTVQLREALESLANDLMVDLTLDDNGDRR
jgi:glycine cleavage system regulatory protein